MRPWQACTGYEATDNIPLIRKGLQAYARSFRWSSDISSECRFIDDQSPLHMGYLILVPDFMLTNSDGLDEGTAARIASI